MLICIVSPYPWSPRQSFLQGIPFRPSPRQNNFQNTPTRQINIALVPANICLDEDVLETSWRSLSSSSSEDAFKTSSRRLDQDEYIHLSHSPSEDVFKTSLRRLDQRQCISLDQTSSRRLQDVFKTFCQVVFKMFSRRPQDVLQKSLQDNFKTFWRRLQDAFKTSSRCLSKKIQGVFKTSSRPFSKRLQDIFNTSSRRSEGVFNTSSRHLQDVLQRCLWDVFKMYRQVNCFRRLRICLGRTFERFMVSVENLQVW